MTKPRILIMAGGTGGHVFPALAVAKQLESLGWEIHWLGTKSGLEVEIVPKSAIPIHYISAKGLRRKGRLAWVLAPFQLITALIQSLLIISNLKPKVVLGMGGFVSGPGGLAAWLLRCPLVVHEQNSIVGMTNHWLSLVAKQVLEAFPGAFQAKANAICIGNPVRRELTLLPLPRVRFQHRRAEAQGDKAISEQLGNRHYRVRLLIIGGSRGADALNKICPKALQSIEPSKRPEIWHQTGGGHEATTEILYQQLAVSARVVPFIEDMAEAYAWADLVLCRSGALTIAELTAVGVGSILVPYPYAVDDHQTTNAYYLTQSNAAILISQPQLSEKLTKTILDFVENEDKLLEMAENARRLAQCDALEQVTQHCIRVSGVKVQNTSKQ